MAFRIEAAVIDLFGLDVLVNECGGWRSTMFGRACLDELIGHYAAKEVEVIDPVIMIRVNKHYRHGMGNEDLYDITRGVWTISSRRAAGAKYAFAVFEGVVREVYEIESWDTAGTTHHRWPKVAYRPGKWEFVGDIAPKPIRERYRLHSVAAYFSPGSQNPIKYVNVPR